MRHRWSWISACFVLILPCTAHGQTKVGVTVTPAELHRPEKLTLTIAKPPADVTYTKAVVKRYRPDLEAKVQAQVKTEELALTPVAGATPPASYTAAIPHGILYGTYDVVALVAGNATTEAEGAERTFTLIPAAAPRISAIDPTVMYPQNEYELTVIGSNFSPNKEDHGLVFDGKREMPTCDDHVKSNCIKVREASPRQVVFSGIDRSLVERHAGAQKVRVRVGTVVSEEQLLPITFSRVERRTPLTLAAWITGGILIFVVAVLIVARSNTPGRRYSLMAMTFLDPETNTYSLSKAQFYVWTLVAVFGYFFLTLSKWLVQGVFELADVPQNLPGIILISAGTATLATGISSARPKGSGATTPSPGDFVTSGGVVAPDRVQFLVWTVVGVAAFIGLLVQSEPGTIRELPKIPEGFLYLMGISAAGYLGGKLARQPGPMVTSATTTHDPATNAYTIQVTGRNLSPEAFLYLDNVRVLPDWLKKTADGAATPEVVMHEDDRRYAKQLKYTIQQVPAPANNTITLATGTVKEKFHLALVNPDGQRSEYQLT